MLSTKLNRAALAICLVLICGAFAIRYQRNQISERPEEMLLAVQSDDVGKIQTLLSQGVDPNDKKRQFALIAGMNGHVKALQALLNAGAKPDPKILEASIERGNLDCSMLILQRNTSLNFSASGADLNLCLLNASKKLEGTGGTPQTVKPIQMVQELLKRGADPKWSIKGDTALQNAARSGYVDVIELLLAKGAKIDEKGTNDHTALSLAVRAHQSDAVKCLLAHGASVEVNPEVLRKAADYSSKVAGTDIRPMLRQAGLTL